MTKTLASIAVVAASWLITAWLLMVTVGVVHAVWIPQLPTVGFAVALLLSALITARSAIAGILQGIVNVVLKETR